MNIKEFFLNDRFAARSGIELLKAAGGYAKASMEITPQHLNGVGVCQGGAIFTLADFAFAVACNSHGKLTFSVDSSLKIFKAEKQGKLFAEARELFNHSRLSNCEVRITNETGELIALFNGTGYRKDIDLPFETLK